MSGRRAQLLERYRARSLDRIRAAARLLVRLEQGEATAEERATIKRELHTLKGDSTIVGASETSTFVHRLETALEAALGGRADLQQVAVTVRHGLEVVEHVLRHALQGEAAQELLGPSVAALGLDALAPAHATAPVPADFSAPVAPAPAERAAAVAHVPAAVPPAPVPAAPSAPEPAPPVAAAPAPVHRELQFLQVDATRLEALSVATGESTTFLRALFSRLRGALGRDERSPDLVRSLQEDLERAEAQLEETVRLSWALRLTPVEHELDELAASARELARSLGKRVRVTTEGGQVEVERGVLAVLREALLHLVRNAVDHGLERPSARGAKAAEGHLFLRARASGPFVVFEVQDDGQGMDVEAIRAAAVARGLVTAAQAPALTEAEVLDFVFHHGFSTRKEVTEVSGRGVGLDVVRSRARQLRGTVGVSSQAGVGTRFSLQVPASVSREPVIVGEVGGRCFGLPSSRVQEVRHLDAAAVGTYAGGPGLRLGDEVLPYRTLGQVVGGDAAPLDDGWVLVFELHGRRLALGVGRLVGERELLRQPLDALFRRLPLIDSSGVLEDGRVVQLFSLDALAGRYAGSGASTVRATATLRRQRVLVVDDSDTVRELLCELLADAGFEVSSANDGRAALGQLEQQLPDLVLSDFEMPHLDGMELTATIKRRWPALPVVMCSTRASADDRRRGVAAGARAYLVKSELKEDVLVSTLRRFLGEVS